MFEVAERRSFVDLIRPPSGYRLEAALGTTYSLDFVALTATLMAMVDAELGEEQRRENPVECLHAITRLADRVQVFVQRARIAGSGDVSKITLLYDRIVHEIQLPDGGNFHPKVWVAYYRPRNTRESEGKPEIVRLICASRNLTTSQYWEAFVAIEGTVGKAAVNDPINTDIASFLGSFVGAEHRKAQTYRTLLAAVRKALFASPGPFRDLTRLRWQAPGRGELRDHLPKAGRKALIVSPFLSVTFLRPILDAYQEVIVISSQEALDEINDDALHAALTAGKNRTYVVEPVLSDEPEPVLNLHAKIFVFEGTKERSAFIGSANGTSSAWRGVNVEASIQFSPGFSIDHFCDRFVWREQPAGSDQKRELRGWIRAYSRAIRATDETDSVEALLDEIRKEIAKLGFLASYDEKGRKLLLNLREKGAELADTIGRWAKSCEVVIGPLSEPGSSTCFQSLTKLADGEITFTALALKDLTEFFVVRATHLDSSNEQEFIVKAATSFDRDERDAQLIESLLTRDRLRSFLEAILFDAAVRPAVHRRPDGRPPPGPQDPTAPLLSDLAIEDILRACTEDASRIDEINRLIRAVKRTELIDTEFREFWGTFVSAHAEAARQEQHA